MAGTQGGSANALSLNHNWTLSPSDFAFLWEECKRCFYLKVSRNFPRPRTVIPGIFRTIDEEMKVWYAGRQTSDAMPFLSPGVIDSSVSWVQSVPLSVPGHTSTCTIKGKLDAVARFSDHTYAVIDFKTSAPRSPHTTLYDRQLHAYALSLENAAPGSPALSPVTKLGLVVFEPQTFSGADNRLASLSGPVRWIEIRRDDTSFLAFLKDVLDILELPKPPDSAPSCEWCRYRDRSREMRI